MKNLTSRILKSTLSVLIVVSMLMGMCTTLFAEGNSLPKKSTIAQGLDSDGDGIINYVSLGDSMTNGYGLDGYKGNSGVETYGKASYANKFAAWLKNNYDCEDVSHAQLAMSGLRAEDLHWLLELDYNDQEAIDLIQELVDAGWDEEKWNAKFTCGDYWTCEEICDHSRLGYSYNYIKAKLPSGYAYPTTHSDGSTRSQKVALIAKYYQEKVTEADIVSLAIGNGNVGVFGFGRILEIVGFSNSNSFSYYTLESAIRELDPALQDKVFELKDILYTSLKEVIGNEIESNPTLKRLADICIYIALSLVLNYAGTVEAILKLNPDADIINVAIMNTFSNEASSEDVSIGSLLEVVVTPINAFIAALPTYMQLTQNSTYAEADFFYAEAAEVECLCEVYGEDFYTGNPSTPNEDSIIRDRFIKSIVGVKGENGDSDKLGMVWELAGQTYIFDLDELIEYEKKTPQEKIIYATVNKSEATAYTMYLAVEKAIIDATKKGAAVSLASILGLSSLSVDFNAIQEDAAKIVSQKIKDNLDAEESDEFEAVCDIIDAQIGGLSSIIKIRSILGDPEGSVTSLRPYASRLEKTPEDFVADLIEAFSAAYTILVGEEAISQALLSDDALSGLFALFARCVIGDGLGAHPSETGHNALFEAVCDAYDNEWTAKKETIENAKVVLNIALDLIAEYYDDAYAYGYQYAKDNGYIDASVDAIDSLIAALNDLDYSDAQMTAEFKNKLDTEIEKVIDILEAAKALLVEADALDEASLNALMDLLAESEEALEGLLGLLAQAGSDIYELAIIPAVQNALYELKNTVIPAAKELAKEIAQKAYAYIVEALGEAYEDLKIIVTNAAKKYLPKLADAIYDYLYNNPKEVIEFIKTYGPYAIDVLEEYGDEALAVIGYVLYLYGEDIAALFIENHEVIFANIIAWFEVHGENTAKLIHVYAEALGLCDAVRDEIAKLKAILEDIKAAYDQASPEVKEALDKLIAQIEKQIAKLEMDVEALKAEIAAVIADVQKLIKEGKEIIAQKIAEIKAEVARLKAEAKATMEALKAEAEKAIKDLKEEVVIQLEKALDKEIETIEDLMEALDAKVAEAIDELVAIVNEIIYNATHGTYVIENDSYYLAMGDSSSFGNSYVEMLVDYLDMRKQYNNISVEGATAEDILLSLDEEIIVEILKSDLITISMSNNTFTVFAANQVAAMITGRPVKELNWSYYLSEEAQEKLYEELDSIYASFIESGMEERYADIAIFAIESFLYSYVSYLFSYTELVATIHEINPEALVVLIGMSNTFDGVVMDLGGSEFAIGEYVQNMVDAANLESFAMAIVGDNTVYVHAPDVETNFNVEEVDFLSFIMEIVLFGAENLYANEAGHEYIFGQIIEALEIHDNRGLIGDADRNGIVDMFDASLVLQYYTQEVKEEEIDLYVSDVDGNGEVDMFDASLILQYYTGEIAVFPVEE